MKITYIFRDQRKGNYSIEELFGGIAKGISLYHDVHKYFCSAQDRFKNLSEVKNLKSDIFHITGDVNYLTFVLPRAKTVLTIHDLGHYEMTLKGCKKLIYKYLWLYLPLKLSGKITTISEFTKSRIIHHFNISPSKIEVIYNPAPSGVFKKLIKKEMSQRPKILQIGSGHNKNIEKLIEAVVGLDVELILLRKYDERLKNKLSELNISHTFYPLLTYEEVYQKYVDCDIVYFASNYEGFGVPILEAQLVGRPIITSRVASMPEVAGDAAHFVDHASAADIMAGILKIIGDDFYRNDLVEKGFRNCMRFTNDHTVNQYLNLYKSIC